MHAGSVEFKHNPEGFFTVTLLHDIPLSGERGFESLGFSFAAICMIIFVRLCVLKSLKTLRFEILFFTLLN